MSEGPWSNRPPAAPPPAPRRPGRGLWTLLILAGLGAIVFALSRLFPGRVQGQDWANVAYLVGFLAVLASGLSRLNRASLPRHLRYAAIWIGLVALLALGLAFQDDLASLFGRPAAGHETPDSAPR
jgi:aspartyl protease family protein